MILFIAAHEVHPATLTWSGGGSGDDTSLTANWGGAAPATGDLLHFGGSIRLTPNQVAALSIGSLTFDSGAGAFTLGGNTYTVTTASGIVNDSANTETINNNITLGIAQTWTAASGNLVFGGNVANGGFGLTISGASNTSASGIISGTGGLTKTGAGTLTLSGANTYSGGTTINGGKLTLNGNTGSLASSGGLTFGGTSTFNYQAASAGSAQAMGALNFTGGDGTVQSTYGLSGNTSLTFSSLAARTAGATENFVITGGTNGTTNKIVLTGVAAGFINQGTFFNGSDFAFMNGAGTYVRGINYGVDANSVIASSGTLSVANQFTKMTATSTVATLAINTLNISGAFNLSIGSSKTLTLTNGGLIKSGGGASTISGGTGLTPGFGVELVIRTDASSDSLTISSVILANGTNALTKSGAGTLTLSGTNTYTGVTTIDGGTLSISADSNLGTAPGSATAGKLVLNGGALGTTANITLSANRGISLGSSGGTFDVASGTTMTYGGIAAGNGSLTKTNTGTLTLSGVNTYTGGTTVSAGTLQLSGSGTLGGTSGSLTVNGGTLDLNGTNQTVGALGGTGGTILNNGTGTARTLTVGTGGGTGSFAGVITDHTAGTGTIAITKTGAGAETLTGANTYTGATTVNAGSLFINGNQSSATGAVTVNNSGTVLGGSGTVGGSVTVASGANLSPGASGTGATAVLNMGALTLQSGSTFNVDLNNATAGSGYDRVSVTGAVSITGSILAVTPGAGLNIGDKLTIVLNDGVDPVTGTFAGLGQGSSFSSGGWSFSIDYTANGGDGTANDIVLTVTAVPEPSTWVAAVLAIGVAGLHLVRRRRTLIAIRSPKSPGNFPN